MFPNERCGRDGGGEDGVVVLCCRKFHEFELIQIAVRMTMECLKKTHKRMDVYLFREKFTRHRRRIELFVFKHFRYVDK